MRVSVAKLLLAVLVTAIATSWLYNHYVRDDYSLRAWTSASSDRPNHTSRNREKHEVVRILSVDGGGVRGLISLEVLNHIEKICGKPIAKLFDFVAGTSTGAIIATQLLLPNADGGNPKYSVDALIEEYAERVGGVIAAPWYHRLLTIDGIFGPKYLNYTKSRMAERVYGTARLNDLLLPIVVPAYSLTDSELHLFTNWDESSGAVMIAPLIVAATSPPSVFPPVRLTGESKEAGLYVDGALVAAIRR